MQIFHATLVQAIYFDFKMTHSHRRYKKEQVKNKNINDCTSQLFPPEAVFSLYITNRSSVHSRSLLCGVCVGNVRRSLLLRWCCGVFSGDSCCRSDSSSRSYIILCSSRAVRFSSRYCFSSTWTTFCMGSTCVRNNTFHYPIRKP